MPDWRYQDIDDALHQIKWLARRNEEHGSRNSVVTANNLWHAVEFIEFYIKQARAA